MACTRRGFERDHLPCLRRGRLQAQHGFKSYDDILESPLGSAIAFFFGTKDDPVNARECERPSVSAICKRDAVLLR
jgi:hypothetical protein